MFAVSLGLLALAASARAQSAAITYTGDAEADFAERVDGRSVLEVVDGTFGPDVGVPVQLGSAVSGWDIARIYVAWDSAADTLAFGIDCFGVCGDADGDGDEGRTSTELASLGGEDLPGLSRGEGFALALDFNLDVKAALELGSDAPPFDFMLGVPAGQPATASENPLPGEVPLLACSRGQTGDDLLSLGTCFGLYDYQQSASVNIARRFLRRTELDGAPWPVRNENPTPSTTSPDLEWVIERFSELKALAGSPFVGVQGASEWQFHMQAFAGSFLDAGVGEDYVPAQNSVLELVFPCQVSDACDICGGDGASCLDCAGTPNGAAVYDECDVCGGDDASCADCAGVPNGPAAYDGCDVCGGDSTSCTDCAGTPAGSARYDACDVCDGDNSSCLDCAGAPNGAAAYDECDVCNGDGSSCCGGDGKECCVDYCGVPDPYWDFILLPVSLDDIVAKLHFTNEIFAWLCNALPSYDAVGATGRELHFGRMAEFNRVFLEECLEDYAEHAGQLYAQLASDNAHPANL